MARILDLPLLVILMGLGALAMLLPSAHAASLRDWQVARVFLFSAVVFLLLTTMIAIASSRYRPRDASRSQLAALIGAYAILPLMLAVPFNEAVADTSYFNAWFEMVSSFTTTGATLYDTPDRLAPSVHLWRALVGWMGGFFVLVSAAAILAPLNLGGVEVISGRQPGREAAGQIDRVANASARLVHHTLLIFPAYTGLTLILWVALLTVGENGLNALCYALSTLSSSGIMPGERLPQSPVGVPTEMLIFLFLFIGITRRSLPGAVLVDRTRPIWADHEVRLAGVFLIVVPGVLFLRHWVGAIEADDAQNLGAALHALWGAVFTTLSFLTTTGFESSGWASARAWSGLGTPGLILLGLAMIGGGIATATGGLKLLRVYALARHGERELNRLVYPSSIGGGGEAQRRLRNDGAYAAWIFFMLYALTLAVFVALLALANIRFEPALVLAVASISTTGPLASLATATPIRYAELGPEVKAILAVAMMIGRLEVLAILAMLSPGTWRR